MSDNERKRRKRETIANRHSLEVSRLNDFRFEINHGLSEVGIRYHACVSLPNQNRDDFTGTDIKDVDSVPGNRVEDGVDFGRSQLRNITLRQRTRIQVEGIRQTYSSRISIIPRLNSVLSGSMPS